MYGASYVGATQLLAAAAAPAALRAIAPHLTASDYHEGWIYQGGAFQLGFAAALVARLARRRRAADAAPPPARTLDALVPAFAAANEDLDPYFARLPLHRPADPARAAAGVPRVAGAARSATTAWRAISVGERYGSIDVPALHIGGWSDIFLEGTLRNYVGLRADAATEEAREGQRLVIGPWAHGNPHEVVGERDFGPRREPAGARHDVAPPRRSSTTCCGRAARHAARCASS